jgi:hypothetical protein
MIPLREQLHSMTKLPTTLYGLEYDGRGRLTYFQVNFSGDDALLNDTSCLYYSRENWTYIIYFVELPKTQHRFVSMATVLLLKLVDWTGIEKL